MIRRRRNLRLLRSKRSAPLPHRRRLRTPDDYYAEDLGIMWPSPVDNRLARDYAKDGQTRTVNVSVGGLPFVARATADCAFLSPFTYGRHGSDLLSNHLPPAPTTSNMSLMALLAQRTKSPPSFTVATAFDPLASTINASPSLSIPCGVPHDKPDDDRLSCLGLPLSLPYEVESLADMDDRLELIVTRLTECVKAREWGLGFRMWNSTLNM